MKNRALRLFALALTLLLCLCACGGGQDSQAQEAVCRQLLTEVFAANADGRYEAFSQAQPDAEAQKEATQAYYAKLEPLCSGELLDTLMANRTLSRYDQQHEGKQGTVESVQLENTGENNYDFTVSLTVDGESLEYTGQISAEKTDGEYRVSRLYCRAL